MPDLVQFAIKDHPTLRRVTRYLVNELAKSHENSVKINGYKVWGQAPTRGYAKWVEELRKRWNRKPKRGRRVMYGTWYIGTFPDQSYLDKAEKFLYAQELIQNLDSNSSGIMVWHDKFLSGAQDFNLLVSPFSLDGDLILPRRDNQSSEYSRLQEVSDHVVEKINQEREQRQAPHIDTMAEVQMRERITKSRKTVAEVLAESPQFKSLLGDEDLGKHHTLDEFREQLQKALEKACHVVKVWEPVTWKASIKRPGLKQAQTFQMLEILGEAVDLERAQQKSQIQIMSIVTPPAPVLAVIPKFTDSAQLPLSEVFAALLPPFNHLRPLLGDRRA